MQYGKYMQLLVESFNAKTVASLMCRDVVSVNHDGRLSDCVSTPRSAAAASMHHDAPQLLTVFAAAGL